jgi:hypothetical protein
MERKEIMNKEIITEQTLEWMKYFVSDKLNKNIDNIEFENYLLDNLYILTVQIHPLSHSEKSIRIDHYLDRFEHYYYHLCQDIFDDKIRKRKKCQPLAIGFYDQEGTRVRSNYKNEMFPHIHALFLPIPETKTKVESIFSRKEKDTYGVPMIRTADIEKYDGNKGIEYVSSYCAKNSFVGKNLKNYSPFKVLPGHFKPS